MKQLALGSFLCDPCLSGIRRNFEVRLVSQVKRNIPGSFSSPKELVQECAGASVVILEGDLVNAEVLESLKA